MDPSRTPNPQSKKLMNLRARSNPQSKNLTGPLPSPQSNKPKGAPLPTTPKPTDFTTFVHIRWTAKEYTELDKYNFVRFTIADIHGIGRSWLVSGESVRRAAEGGINVYAGSMMMLYYLTPIYDPPPLPTPLLSVGTDNYDTIASRLSRFFKFLLLKKIIHMKKLL